MYMHIFLWDKRLNQCLNIRRYLSESLTHGNKWMFSRTPQRLSPPSPWVGSSTSVLIRAWFRASGQRPSELLRAVGKGCGGAQDGPCSANQCHLRKLSCWQWGAPFLIGFPGGVAVHSLALIGYMQIANSNSLIPDELVHGVHAGCAFPTHLSILYGCTN